MLRYDITINPSLALNHYTYNFSKSSVTLFVSAPPQPKKFKSFLFSLTVACTNPPTNCSPYYIIIIIVTHNTILQQLVDVTIGTLRIKTLRVLVINTPLSINTKNFNVVVIPTRVAQSTQQQNKQIDGYVRKFRILHGPPSSVLVFFLCHSIARNMGVISNYSQRNSSPQIVKRSIVWCNKYVVII